MQCGASYFVSPVDSGVRRDRGPCSKRWPRRVPVIAVAFGGPAEIVDETVGRALAADGIETVIAGFADTLRDVVHDPQAWRRRGAEGRRRAESCFGWDAKVDRAIAIYAALMAPGGVRPPTLAIVPVPAAVHG